MEPPKIPQKYLNLSSAEWARILRHKIPGIVREVLRSDGVIARQIVDIVHQHEAPKQKADPNLKRAPGFIYNESGFIEYAPGEFIDPEHRSQIRVNNDDGTRTSLTLVQRPQPRVATGPTRPTVRRGRKARDPSSPNALGFAAGNSTAPSVRSPPASLPHRPSFGGRQPVASRLIALPIFSAAARIGGRVAIVDSEGSDDDVPRPYGSGSTAAQPMASQIRMPDFSDDDSQGSPYAEPVISRSQVAGAGAGAAAAPEPRISNSVDSDVGVFVASQGDQRPSNSSTPQSAVLVRWSQLSQSLPRGSQRQPAASPNRDLSDSPTPVHAPLASHRQASLYESDEDDDDDSMDVVNSSRGLSSRSGIYSESDSSEDDDISESDSEDELVDDSNYIPSQSMSQIGQRRNTRSTKAVIRRQRP